MFFHHSAASPTVNEQEAGEETELLGRTDETANKPITFFRAWFLPGVAMVMKL
jgi:hypothetical protein